MNWTASRWHPSVVNLFFLKIERTVPEVIYWWCKINLHWFLCVTLSQCSLPCPENRSPCSCTSSPIPCDLWIRVRQRQTRKPKSYHFEAASLFSVWRDCESCQLSENVTSKMLNIRTWYSLEFLIHWLYATCSPHSLWTSISLFE